MTDDRAPALFAAAPLLEQGQGVSASARDRMLEGIPANTSRAYTRWHARWWAWCDAEGRRPLPATEDTLAEFANMLADEGKARSTIGQAVSAVRKLHELAGHLDEPPLRATKLVLRGYTRQQSRAGRRARQAPPATVPVLRAMIDTLDPTLLVDVRDHALVVMGFAMFARRSEVAGLQLEDIEETEHGLSLWIREAKTDKTGEGQTSDLIRMAHPELDPVTVFRRWREKLHARQVDRGPLFRPVDRHGNLGQGGMSDDAVSDVVRKLAERARVARASEYTGHSLRAGAATSALDSGASMSSVCRAGRWVDGSQAVGKYHRSIDRWRDHPLRNVGVA